jgi:hypothetical protein
MAPFLGDWEESNLAQPASDLAVGERAKSLRNHRTSRFDGDVLDAHEPLRLLVLKAEQDGFLDALLHLLDGLALRVAAVQGRDATDEPTIVALGDDDLEGPGHICWMVCGWI